MFDKNCELSDPSSGISVERGADVMSVVEKFHNPDSLIGELESVGYVVDKGLATALYCAARLPKPVLLEGEPGIGKTQAALSLAEYLDTPIFRLQCFEGIDASEAIYEWNYPR